MQLLKINNAAYVAILFLFFSSVFLMFLQDKSNIITIKERIVKNDLTLAKESNNATTFVEKKKESLKELMVKKQSLSDRNARLDTLQSDFSTSLTKYQHDLTAANTNIAKAQAEKSFYKQRYERLEKSNENIKRELEFASKKIKEIQETNSKMEKAVSDSKSNVLRHEQDLRQVQAKLRLLETHTKNINFHQRSKDFIETLSSCLNDKECNVFYHHVKKTGGTTLENRMFGAFPFHEKRKKQRTCCGKKIMKYFDRYHKYYCRLNFTSYQVSASQFESIVSTCMELNLKRNESSRAVVIVSIRDPETRTLSNIHQICNKNFHKREKEIKEACSSCDYEKHSELFDKIVHRTNKDYEDALMTTHLTKKMQGIKVLTFDTEDMDVLLDMLRKKLPNHFTFSKNKKINQEEITRCDFGMKSSMFQKLALSREIYRNLTSG